MKNRPIPLAVENDHRDEAIRVKIEIQNNSLCLICFFNGEIRIYEKKLTGFNPAAEQSMMNYFCWMLNILKPLFFRMPVADITVEFTQECKDKINNMIVFAYNLLKNTNDTLKCFSDRKNMAASHENVLFFNVGENINFRKIYQNCMNMGSSRLRYLDFDPGFNPVERRWEKTPPPMSVEEFVQYIKENRIRKIVSINHYLLEKYQDQGIYILAVFKYLGLEYIIIDLDNYDLTPQGYLYKCFYNVEEFDRFSYTEFHVFWDRYYGLSNVSRIIFPHEDKKPFAFQELDDDYHIVVMSNSRINDVIPMLNPIVFILDQFKEGSFFEELCLWYYSMRYLILSCMDLNEYEKLNFNALLLRFAYNASQLIKYSVIDGIKTDRKIELYGDSGWQNLFPEYYQTYLDRKGIDEVLTKGLSLNLLMNWQVTWVETSAVIFEALNYRVPFINHPALVKTEKLKGLSRIEYHSSEDLNLKLQDIKPHLNSDLIESINNFNFICNGNMDFIVSRLHPASKKNKGYETIIKELDDHDRLLQERINGYVSTHYDFLRFTFKSLFMEPAPFDIRKSPYFSKPFMQRLIHYADNKR